MFVFSVRVFISSTFKDFYNEREILVKKVFPRLKDFCLERGLFLVECDLRWGVPKDATNVQAISTCLDEIERSIEEMSGKNFFLALLGDRYGWTPSFEQMSSHIINKFEWIEGASVTLMEIVHGFLRTKSPNCLIMQRLGENVYLKMPSEQQVAFIEKDPEIVEKVKIMKDVLNQVLRASNQIHFYSCQYSGKLKDPLTYIERIHLSGLEDFEQKVCDFFEEAIIKTFAENASTAISEKDEHLLMLNALNRSSMEAVLLPDDLLQLLDSPKDFLQVLVEEKNDDAETVIVEGNTFACLVGSAGSGKSTMMATLIQHLKRLHSKSGDDGIFYHFSGASISSKLEQNLVKRLQSLVQHKQNIDLNNEAKESFFEVLTEFGLKHVEKTCYILIDAVDEMASDLKWLPDKPLPQNVVCIISCLEGSDFYKIPSLVLKTIKMPPLSSTQSHSYTKSYFNEYGKTLDKQDSENLLIHNSSNNPLWLSLACEEIRLHGDYSSLSSVIQLIPEDISELYQKILFRIIQQDSSELTKTFLQLLFVSRIGLWENELEGLILAFTDNHQIAKATITDLFRTLKPFTHRIGIPVPIIKIRHRIVADVIKATVFKPNVAVGAENGCLLEAGGEDQIKKFHSQMADYFKKLLNQHPNGTLCNYQHMESVYHRYYAGERSVVMKELWSKIGVQTFSTFQRSRLFNSLRCCQMTNPPGLPGTEPVLLACQFCLMERRTPFGNCCYYCGLHTSSTTSHPARMCTIHRYSKHDWNSICAICEKFFHPSMLKSLSLCMLCDGLGAFCSVLVKEEDFHFGNTVQNRINVDACFSLDR